MVTRTLFLAVMLASPACIEVRERGDGRSTEVNISAPGAGLAVRTGESSRDTGLPVYPGARLADDDSRDSNRANVSIGTPWFGIHVRAAEYRSSDTQAKVLEFYREQLKQYGAVTECHGDVDFRRGQPVCESQVFEDDVKLVTGTEDRHHIVSVKSRGDGSQFALVFIETGTRQ